MKWWNVSSNVENRLGWWLAMWSCGREGHLNSLLSMQRCVAVWGQFWNTLYSCKKNYASLDNIFNCRILHKCVCNLEGGSCSRTRVAFVQCSFFFFSSQTLLHICRHKGFSYPLVRCQLKKSYFYAAARQQMALA